MAIAVGRTTMTLAEWIEVGSCRCAAIGVVTELVHVHASLSIGIMAGDVVGDSGRRGFGGLLKGHLAGDLGVAAKDCYWRAVSGLRR